MAGITIIFFVRHGQVNNRSGLFYGRLPRFQLSQLGYHQAEATANALRHIRFAAVFSSPLLRARLTARVILRYHPNVKLHRSALLSEVHCPYDGHPISEVIARNWDVYTGSGPDYEQPTDVLARTQAFVARVRHQYRGRSVLAVTHGDTIVCQKLWTQGIALTSEHKEKAYPEPGSVHVFAYATDEIDEIPYYHCVPIG